MAPRKPQTDGPQLVIVESPAKAKTINKYLGKGYVVKASMGHVRDLPERSLAIDVENNFQPTYEIVEGRRRIVSELKKLAEKAETVFLATDLDREGEAIAWHLASALNLPPEKIRRVIFNEITESAIRAAFANPHQIDMDKVNAQQARRILDRIVGYELSPLLWKKIAKGLSAGRVQSVAVRMICDREQEIRDFIPSESWKITGHFVTAIDKADDLAKAWRDFLANEGNGDEGRKLREQAEWLAAHGGFALDLSCRGDLHIDEHHTVEDCALALGEALRRALGTKVGIARYGFVLPMDEALTQVAIDLSGRAISRFQGRFERERVGELPTELVPHFFRSLADALGAAIHVSVTGENSHHMIEGCFKAVGRALRQALRRDSDALPSTKGVL